MRPRYPLHTLMALALGILLYGTPVEARIKMVALPERAKTIIRLDNPKATLIQEERSLTLQKGVNKVDFSWKAVRIDPDSIRLSLLNQRGGVSLLSVSYPPKEEALVWDIHSKDAVEVSVRISYLLFYFDRLITYKAIADKDEERISLKSFLVLRNFSGEDFLGATVQPGGGRSFETNIKRGETKQLLFFKNDNLPIEKRWVFDAKKLPWDPEKVDRNVGIPVTYRLNNVPENGLGKAPLHKGKIRVFQEDGHGSTIFLGEDRSGIVPVGEDMEIYIGDSRDIVVTQRKMREKRINVRRNRNNRIVLYDTDEQIKASIENFKDKPARLIMIQYIPGQWDMEACNMEYTRKDAHTLEFEVGLPARGKQELVMRYHRRNIR